MPIRKIEQLLAEREFLNLATVDSEGQPHAVPKFFLKFTAPYLYLVDYTFGKTVENLRVNARASIGFMDVDNLEGYRLNGLAELIEKGHHFKILSEELEKKLIRLSATRVIEGSKTGKRSSHFELEIPDHFVAIKFKITDITKIDPRGVLYKENEILFVP